MNKCTSFAGHFDSHGSAMVQYCVHHLMDEVQGFHKSHNATIRQILAHYRPDGKTAMQYVSTLLTISMAVAVRRYYTARIAQWCRSMSFIKATKRCHWASTRSDIIKGTSHAANLLS